MIFRRCLQATTRLHELAQDGNEAELAHLLDQGANVEECDSEGSTVLHFACDAGSLQVPTHFQQPP